MVWQLSAEVITAWVRASCELQGVAVRVTDPQVLGRVAVLLTGRAGASAARATARARRPAPAEDHSRQIGSTRDGSSD
jgi:hypothetical protein